MTYKELIAQRDALNLQIEETRTREHTAAIAKVKELMMEHGLTLADLSTRTTATKNTTGKVAAKYRHPSTGESWSGRGLQPKWLKAALAAGGKIDDFAVKA